MSVLFDARLRQNLSGIAAVATFLLLVVLLGTVLVGCGPEVRADTTESVEEQPSGIPATSAGGEDSSGLWPGAPSSSTTTVPAVLAGSTFFDSSVVHEISVSFATMDYDAIIETFQNSGEKDWMEATVTIDGATYENVGMRLKGNSSIMGIRGDGRPEGPGSNVSADDPEKLPWLVRLDKYVDGQNHDGITDLVVRSNTSQTSLNEAVALELLDMAGLASQEAVACRFSVNGGETALRLVTELPDDLWMAKNFSASGALYKAESTGDYSYRGTDPSSYEEVFDQEAGKDNADLTPLMEFLDFINNADDETFNTELADRLDIESFATYLAMEDLLANFDDIDGPGNNSYLYYDPVTGVFTVVPWDHNLAFGGRNAANGGQEGAAQRPSVGRIPAGQQLPGNRPQGEAMKARDKSNVLVERFRANTAFEALYQQQLVELKARLYGDGAAADVLDQWVRLLKTQASDLVDTSTVDQEAAKIASYFGTE